MIPERCHKVETGGDEVEVWDWCLVVAKLVAGGCFAWLLFLPIEREVKIRELWVLASVMSGWILLSRGVMILFDGTEFSASTQELIRIFVSPDYGRGIWVFAEVSNSEWVGIWTFLLLGALMGVFVLRPRFKRLLSLGQTRKRKGRGE